MELLKRRFRPLGRVKCRRHLPARLQAQRYHNSTAPLHARRRQVHCTIRRRYRCRCSEVRANSDGCALRAGEVRRARGEVRSHPTARDNTGKRAPVGGKGLRRACVKAPAALVRAGSQQCPTQNSRLRCALCRRVTLKSWRLDVRTRPNPRAACRVPVQMWVAFAQFLATYRHITWHATRCLQRLRRHQRHADHLVHCRRRRG